MTPGDIRTIRQRLGLSRAQLAEALGVSPRTVENWEWQGRQTPVDPLLPRALRDLERELMESSALHHRG